MDDIGLLYVNGDGIPQDYAKAREWCEKAAASGEPLAEKLARAGLAILRAAGH